MITSRVPLWVCRFCVVRMSNGQLSTAPKHDDSRLVSTVRPSDINQTFAGKTAVVRTSEPAAKLQHRKRIVAGHLVEDGKAGNPYEDMPVLQPTESLDDPDSELSEGARLWFGQIVQKAESGELDIREVVEPSIDIVSQLRADDNLAIDHLSLETYDSESSALSDISEGKIINLKIPTPVPRRRFIPKTYTVAPIVNHSETLQKLVEMGVNLSAIENKHNAVDLLLKCNYSRVIEPVLQFLAGSCRLAPEQLGPYITSNPWIFQQRIDDLQVRRDYLESKGFSDEAIGSIVTKAAFWLNMNVKILDSRLGWLQQEFGLSGDEVRLVVVEAPQLMFGIGYAQTVEFALHEEMGFTVDDMKQLMIKCPHVYLRERQSVVATFDYVQNKLGFSHQRIVQWPWILRYDVLHIQTRHSFLKKHKRDQYDPTLPNFVSLERLVQTPDHLFAVEVAKSSLTEFNRFMKSI